MVTVMFRQVVLMFIFTGSLVLGQGLPLLAQESLPPDSPQQIIVRVDGASCPFCAFGLEKRLGHIEGVADVKIEMKAGKAIVTLKKAPRFPNRLSVRRWTKRGSLPARSSFPRQDKGSLPLQERGVRCCSRSTFWAWCG